MSASLPNARGTIPVRAVSRLRRHLYACICALAHALQALQAGSVCVCVCVHIHAACMCAGVTPGVYAIIGSAAMLSAVSRMTVSLVVIIFELTDGIDYIMPTTICILVAKWVSDAFGRDGVLTFHPCMHVCMRLCMYVYTYVCMCVCMHVCMYTGCFSGTPRCFGARRCTHVCICAGGWVCLCACLGVGGDVLAQCAHSVHTCTSIHFIHTCMHPYIHT